MWIKNFSDIFCFFYYFVCFVLFLEGRSKEENERDVKKMKLPGCWGKGYGHL